MEKIFRDVGGWGGQGDRRYRRYRDAFDWVECSVAKGYYLEAIAILDSLITDRLSSRLGYIWDDRIESEFTCRQLCKRLLGEDKSSRERPSEQETEFRDVIRNIEHWGQKRNAAVHATAKVFRSDDPRLDFEVIRQSYRQVALDGIKCLQDFDELDTASRAKVSPTKYPGSYPNAFFPKRRGKMRLKRQ